MYRTLRLLTFCALIATCSVVQADDGEPRERVIELTITPAAAPVPALKYPLLPPLPELQPQDAVLIYARMYATGNAGPPQSDADRELLGKLLDMPLSELSVKEAHDLYTLRTALYEGALADAARCRDCSWALPLGRRNFFEIPLTEITPLRHQGWLLALRTRVQIVEGDVDGALESIRVGYAAARHAATGPTLVHAMVGVSISGAFSERVVELATLPDAPNLYWSLSQLPRPFLDTRDALASDMYCMEMSFPDWKNPRSTNYEDAYWDAFLARLHAGMQDMSPNPRQDLDLATIREKSYPAAKQHLLDTGMSAEEVEKVCPAQAIVILTVDTYNRHRDEVFKWAYLPFETGQAGLLEAIEKVGTTLRNDQGLPLAQLVLPALANFRKAMQRQERQFALVRTIEALRMHAAEHDGQLPSSLADVTCVPVPTDPWAGKPFEYSLEGEVAKLRAAAPEGQPVELTVEYRLKMRKK